MVVQYTHTNNHRKNIVQAHLSTYQSVQVLEWILFPLLRNKLDCLIKPKYFFVVIYFINKLECFSLVSIYN
jgi:hypothetical protein